MITEYVLPRFGAPSMALGMGPMLWEREFCRTHPTWGYPLSPPTPRELLKRWPTRQAIAARRYYRALDRVNLGMVRP